MTLTLEMTVTYSGGGLNPAVVLGAWISNIVQDFEQNESGIGAHFGAYYGGPILGALFAVMAHYLYEDVCGDEQEEARSDEDIGIDEEL